MATFYGDQELDAQLAEFGRVIEYETAGEQYEVRGIVDEADDAQFSTDGSTIVGRQRSVLIRTGALPAIGEGSVIRFDGVAYRVTVLRREDDGALTRIYCARS